MKVAAPGPAKVAAPAPAPASNASRPPQARSSTEAPSVTDAEGIELLLAGVDGRQPAQRLPVTGYQDLIDASRRVATRAPRDAKRAGEAARAMASLQLSGSA